MKKKIRSSVFLLIAGSAFVFNGCAIPERRVGLPPKPVSSVQRSQNKQLQPVIPSATQDPEVASSPQYFEIEDQDGSEIIIDDIEAKLPTMGYVNDRIFEYGRKLDRWKELDGQSVNQELGEKEVEQMVRCFRRLQTVLNGYNELRLQMLQAQKLSTAMAASNAEILELQKNDIIFLEGECGQLLADKKSRGSVTWAKREEGADLGQIETLVDRYASNNEFEEVVKIWQKIPEFQIPRVNLRTKIGYGNALMYLGQEEKAADIYRQVVDQMSDSREQATDLVSLRKMLADLYTAAGAYKAAEVQYKKISEDYSNLGTLEEWSKLQLSILARSVEDSSELSEYSLLMKSFLGFLPEKDGYKVVWQAEKFLESYPYSPVSSNADYIKLRAAEIANEWFDSFMAEVDDLKAQKKFDEALELLETMPVDIVSAEKQINVKSKTDELLLAAAVDRETVKMVEMQKLQDQWNDGILLVRGGRYDEAINVFTNLLETDYSLKAEKKIQEVALEAAKADRKKAAQLFIRYTKTTEPESRKKLLVESRKILRNILTKYPDVAIKNKVLGNIDRVEQEMNLLDPNLVLQADSMSSDAAGAGDDGVDNAFQLTDRIEEESIEIEPGH